MERTCVVCHLRPFQFRCIQCHKPVCDECAFKTSQGVFCCRDCASAYRSFKGEFGKPVRKASSGGILKTIVALAILAALGYLAFKIGLIPRLGRP